MTATIDPLQPVVDLWFPIDAAEFRAIHQQTCAGAPLEAVGQVRAQGLACMTDDEVEQLARALQLAHLRRPSDVDRLWHFVIVRGMA
ncbi:hypothetical protein GO986_08720 [Deinococcus sp. HMF7620]|uniref:Uncharacterized protein n=1 Tax=Deinococcus arboris TaxID=2682977 RepID=A0A7C9M621_9DEIO|nr:hypothetical protein [Deinococcus arboris]MVN86845.1 hypothetical protein [Deinococcus arboris]